MFFLSSLVKNTRMWLALGTLALAASSFLGWKHYYPVQAADGWSFKVYLDRSPQTIISIAPVRFLVAEQGRGRILELNHVANAKQ